MKPIAILVIDNDLKAQQQLIAILNHIGGLEIHAAANANEAWAKLRTINVDAILSAWDMTDMSGLALLKIVRGDDRLYHLPFFLIHHAYTKSKVLEAGHAGVTGLLVYPFDPGNLETKIEALTTQELEPTLVAAEQQLSEGLQLLEKSEYGRALKTFEGLLEQVESAEVYYNIGYIKTAQGQYGDAILAFRKAVEIDRLFAKAYEAMGRAYRKMGQLNHAQQCLQQAADIYMSKEKVDHAEHLLNEILEINPETVNVFNSLGVLYRKKGDLPAALFYYQKALKVHPDEPHIYYNIGRLYIDMDDFGQAKRVFSQALQLAPEFQEARETLDALQRGAFQEPPSSEP